MINHQREEEEFDDEDDVEDNLLSSKFSKKSVLKSPKFE